MARLVGLELWASLVCGRTAQEEKMTEQRQKTSEGDQEMSGRG